MVNCELTTYPAWQTLMQILKFIHQLVAFLLELIMLVAFGYWGFKSNQSLAMKWAAGIGLPLVAIVLWGIFAAPRSAHRLPLPYQILFSWVLFGLAGYILYQTGPKTMSLLFLSFAFLSGVVAYFTER